MRIVFNLRSFLLLFDESVAISQSSVKLFSDGMNWMNHCFPKLEFLLSLFLASINLTTAVRECVPAHCTERILAQRQGTASCRDKSLSKVTLVLQT